MTAQHGRGLGVAIERDGSLVWEGTGRPLSGWERRMRDARTDLWLEAFDGGLYRFCLPGSAIASLEHDISLPAMLASLERALKPSSSAMPPGQQTCLSIIEAATIGGGMVVRDGASAAVSPDQAAALVEFHLSAAPIETIMRLAAVILRVAIDGRPATEQELARFTIPVVAVPPLPLAA